MAETFKQGIQRQVANPLEDRLAALEAAEQGGTAPIAVEEPQVVEEDIGLGVPAHGSVEEAEINMIRNKLKQLKNPKFHAPLLKRIAEIQAQVAAANAAAAAAEE